MFIIFKEKQRTTNFDVDHLSNQANLLKQHNRDRRDQCNKLPTILKNDASKRYDENHVETSENSPRPQETLYKPERPSAYSPRARKRPKTGSCSSTLKRSISTPITLSNVLEPFSDILAEKARIGDYEIIIALKSYVKRLRLWRPI
jgi:hypothetical protein